MPNELYHHGIKGQKWGVRRYQNPDGSLTALGKTRYGAEAVGKLISDTGKKLANTAKTTSQTIARGATAAGKVLGKFGKTAVSAAGSATKKTTKAAVMAFKKRHPWMMSESELAEAKARQDRINAFKESRAKYQKGSFASDLVKSSIKTGVDTIVKTGATSLGKEIAKRLATSEDERAMNTIKTKRQLIEERMLLEDKENEYNARHH